MRCANIKPLVQLISIIIALEAADCAAQDYHWRANYRAAIDLSTRNNQNFVNGSNSWTHFLGLDLHKVFSTSAGDIGTLVFQPYLTKLSNVNNPPFFFDDGDDWELVWRIANFNYTALSRGGFNIRVGHFEIPFGLEQNIDTNGTLRQYTFTDRAIKVDWGITVNGKYSGLDYEIALSRGSGNEFTARHDPYLLSGRIATSSQKNFIVGFSWMYGDVLTSGRAVPRARAGVDLAYYIASWEFLIEASGGSNDGLDTANVLGEVSWRSPFENLHLYAQFRHVNRELPLTRTDRSRFSLGTQLRLNQKFSASAELSHDIDPLDGRERDLSALLQLRVRI